MVLQLNQQKWVFQNQISKKNRESDKNALNPLKSFSIPFKKNFQTRFIPFPLLSFISPTFKHRLNVLSYSSDTCFHPVHSYDLSSMVGRAFSSIRSFFLAFQFFNPSSFRCCSIECTHLFFHRLVRFWNFFSTTLLVFIFVVHSVQKRVPLEGFFFFWVTVL